MKKEDVLNYFGGVTATARALRITHSAVSQWKDELSGQTAFKVELVSKGYFKTDETRRMERKQ